MHADIENRDSPIIGRDGNRLNTTLSNVRKPACPDVTRTAQEQKMDDDNTQWSWTDDMRKRVAEEMTLHVDLDDNGIAGGE